jgi:hypothetical protein
MTQMRVTMCTARLDALHAVAAVIVASHGGRDQWLEETWSAGARVVFAVRVKQTVQEQVPASWCCYH